MAVTKQDTLQTYQAGTAVPLRCPETEKCIGICTPKNGTPAKTYERPDLSYSRQTLSCMNTAQRIEARAEGLSTEQEAAFRMLCERLLEPGAAHYTLQGYAGTGKTFVAARIAEVLDADGIRVVAAAPTHRATAEIRRALETSATIETCTLPSLLGLVLRADGAGGYHLVPDGRAQLPEGGVVLCDEASMVGEETMDYVKATRQGIRWLFLGDPAQLPPVGEAPSAVFDLPGATLTEIVRQARDNPIIEFSRRAREGLPHLRGDHLRYDGEQGVAVTRSRPAFLESAVRAFRSTAYKDDPTIARVLAYRNAVVDRYNREIRAAIYGEDAREYVPGEWLVARETWMPYDFPVILNSEALKVVSAQRTVDPVALGGEWAVWRLLVQPDGRDRREITVLAAEEGPRYAALLKRYRDKAVEARLNDVPDAASDAWNDFYRLKEQYAQVGYGFASTVHKAQGGTFQSIFADYRDLHHSREPERRALKYVAGTRPRLRLALLV